VNSDFHFQTPDALTARLTALRVVGHTWDEIAALAEFGGSSAGLLSSILKGYEPKTNATRKKLGLAPLAVEVEPCGDCGEAHMVGWCVKAEGEPQRPKPPKRKRRQIRLAASVTEEERELLQEMAAAFGLTWSEYCQELAARFIEDRSGLYLERKR
jgi:hypothetical protein